jgi:hypothetical protein
MNNCIPKEIKELIPSSSCSKLTSFSYKSETFRINDDVYLNFNSSPEFFRARITNIFFITNLKPSIISKRTKKIRKKKLKPKKKKIMSRNKNIIPIHNSVSDQNSTFSENLIQKSKKLKFKNKPKVALIVEVQFYFSVDDLEEIEEKVSCAKELFLSQKKHLVYGFNIIGKCYIFKGSYSSLDGFYSTRLYDPVHRKILEQGTFCN